MANTTLSWTDMYGKVLDQFTKNKQKADALNQPKPVSMESGPRVVQFNAVKAYHTRSNRTIHRKK